MSGSAYWGVVTRITWPVLLHTHDCLGPTLRKPTLSGWPLAYWCPKGRFRGNATCSITPHTSWKFKGGWWSQNHKFKFSSTVKSVKTAPQICFPSWLSRTYLAAIVWISCVPTYIYIYIYQYWKDFCGTPPAVTSLRPVTRCNKIFQTCRRWWWLAFKWLSRKRADNVEGEV